MFFILYEDFIYDSPAQAHITVIKHSELSLGHGALPEVVFESVVLLGVVGKSDMLRGVVAEAVCSAGYAVV